MGRKWATFLVLALLSTFGLDGAFPGHDQSSTTVLTADVDLLVRQLGDRSFSVRKRAMNQLMNLGAGAFEALERGVHSTDREISFRSRHALKIVRQNDFQRRLQAFASGRDNQESYALPSWGAYAKEVGTSPAARTLFVEMQQAEPQLLATLEDGPGAVNEALAIRLEALQQSTRFGQQSQKLSLGTLTTLLFLLGNTDSMAPGGFSAGVGSFLQNSTLTGALEAGSQREVIRKIVGRWMEKTEGLDAYYALHLALRFNISHGLVPAKGILTGGFIGAGEPYFRGYALLAVAKFGDESHLPLVETFLEDTTPYGFVNQAQLKTRPHTQIRDIALATLLHLTEKNPANFGFSRLRTNSVQVFNPESLAFEDDSKREAAIDKWRKYRSSDTP